METNPVIYIHHIYTWNIRISTTIFESLGFFFYMSVSPVTLDRQHQLYRICYFEKITRVHCRSNNINPLQRKSETTILSASKLI